MLKLKLHQKRNQIVKQELKHKRNKLIISAILSLPLLLVMVVHISPISIPSILVNPWVQLILSTPVQFIIGGNFTLARIKICEMVQLTWMYWLLLVPVPHIFIAFMK